MDEGVGSSMRRPVFSRWFPHAARLMDAGGLAEHRRELLAGLEAETVLEVGPGSGANFVHYPRTVGRVIAVEPEPRLRELAAAEAERVGEETGVRIEVVAGTSERLPVAESSVDAVVTTHVLCTVPDLLGSLAAFRRMLLPGGRLVFIEHVRGDTRRVARVQRALDATVWPLLVGGCHVGRDIAVAIEEAGFVDAEIAEFRFPPGSSAPTAFHISGTARRP